METPEKPSREPALPSQDETRRANVLREEMLSQFRMLGETLSGFRDRMDRMEPQVQQTNETVIILEAAVRSQGANIHTIKSNVAEIKAELKNYNHRLEGVETKLAS